MQFACPNLTTMHVVNVNPRREKHGEDNVPAVDLKLRMEAANDVLAMFDKNLVAAIYCKSGEPQDNPQQALDGVAPVSNMPNVRFPDLEPLRFSRELTGYTLRIDKGLGGKSDLVLADCTLDGFMAECKEGGTVVLTWRLRTSKAQERELGRLSTLIDSDIQATLVGPKIDEVKPAGDEPQGDGIKEPVVNGSAGNAAWPFPLQAKGAGADPAPV